MLENLGIAAELAARREKYARFAYVAPHDRLPREPVVKVEKPKEAPPRPRHRTTHAGILNAVAEAFNVTVGELLCEKRHQKLARARFAAMRLIQETGKSTPQIGKSLGGRDHSTVISGLRKASRLLGNDSEWTKRYHRARALAQGGK